MNLRALVPLLLTFALLPTVASERISLKPSGGVYTVPVQINGALTIDFLLDTGASDVIIPADVALTLMRMGTIDRSDYLGSGQYSLADGSIVENAKINFRRLQIGSRVLYDVRGAIGSVDSSLLLGQSALQQLEPWRLDTKTGHLVFMESASADPVLGNVPVVAQRPDSLGTVALASGALKWRSDWGHGIRATARTSDCPVDEFSAQGYAYALEVDIPQSRLKKAGDAWGVAEGRALTVRGCWFMKSDGLAHAKMRRKKDGKVWEQDLNFEDGSWTSSADGGTHAW
jgi:clan AA aspartic protease (TIGR02281 family)